MSVQTQTSSRPTADKSQHGLKESSVHDLRCPDPSAHQTKDTSLQDHAAAEAFHHQGSSDRHADEHRVDPLGPDGKLSSAGAATSLKYARAQDLPAYPVVGVEDQHSAGTAANLAHAHPKSPEWWKPERSSAAGTAANLASHIKTEPVWQPEASAAGSKAALLAHKEGPKANTWVPKASSAGNSAANIAMKKQSVHHAPDNSARDMAGRNSLIAATGAVSSSGRKRAQSHPLPPASNTDSSNALRAATLAHRPSTKATAPSPYVGSNRLSSPAMEAARIQHSRTNREMYTEHPPVALEVDEKNHQNALRASALSMAKVMYDTQQRNQEKSAGRSAAEAAQGRAGASTAHDKKRYSNEADIKEQARRYLFVQEAAQKLAAERLAKIDFDQSDNFRTYYGYENPTKSRLRRLSRRGRASSNPEPYDSDDEFQSRRIRNQMTQLNKNLADVDAKRNQDRKHLLAAAERKVKAQMHGMDEKIFNETGTMSPAMIEEWDARARAKAAANSEARMANHGKVHIGGGKYIDQSEIDAVAAARVQPTLDEISDKVEKQKAKEEEMRLDREEEKRQAQIEKERAAEIKAEEKRAKEEKKRALKSHNVEEKSAAKDKHKAEQAKISEEQHMQKEEERKSAEASRENIAQGPREVALATPAGIASPTTDEDNDDLYSTPPPVPERNRRASGADHAISSSPSATPPTSPTSTSKSGFKGLFNKLRRRSKHSAATAENEQPGFIARLGRRGSSPSSFRGSQPQSPTADMTAQPAGNRSYSDVSSMSSVQSLSEGRSRQVERTATTTTDEEARDGFDEALAPPPTFTTIEANSARIGSPTRESKFREVGI